MAFLVNGNTSSRRTTRCRPRSDVDDAASQMATTVQMATMARAMVPMMRDALTLMSEPATKDEAMLS